jgi:HEAT repeat protein
MRSKHPDALKTLLEMQNDTYWFVRLRVVQGYGENDMDESGALLRKMLNDENKGVREQAQMYLGKRGLK